METEVGNDAQKNNIKKDTKKYKILTADEVEWRRMIIRYIKHSNIQGYKDNDKENKELRRRKIILINNYNNKKGDQELITFFASLGK